MTTNTWQPAPKSTSSTDSKNALAEALKISQSHHLSDAIKALSKSQQDQLHILLHLPKADWAALVEDLNQKQIIQLIYLFTLAEFLKPEFEVGNNSPVISLNKLLKKRKQPLSKEQLQWIKDNSSNKFLPNGSVF
jgi:hypothetical protein